MTDNDRRVVKEFLDYESSKGGRQRWIRSLQYRVSKLFDYLAQSGLSLQDIRVKDAYNYQGWLIETGRNDGRRYSNNSICNYMTCASCFYNYLKIAGIIHTNPFLEVKKIRGENRLPKNILKEKQMHLFLKEIAKYDEQKMLTNKINRYRVHVATELLYSTGLRVSEVALLRVEDIDFDRGIVYVSAGKGGNSRIAFLNEYAKRVLQLYVTEMRPHIFNCRNRENATVFGVGWSSFTHSVNRIVKDISAKLGYGTVTSHGFRHAVGFHLLRAGCDVRYIQSILGHQRLKTTEIYTKVEKDDLRDVLDKYHPRKCKRSENEKIGL